MIEIIRFVGIVKTELFVLCIMLMEKCARMVNKNEKAHGKAVVAK